MAGGNSGGIDQQRVNVVVFGAGITGLTVAQELAERRFKVWVVEPTFDVNRHGNWTMAIGGMARTQYAAVDDSVAHKALAQSRFPLAHVPMHAQPPQALTEIPPHVAEYIKRLDDPDAYGQDVLLRCLCEGGNRNPLVAKLHQLFPGKWSGRWDAEPFEKPHEVPPTRSSVTLVRRARSVTVRFVDHEFDRLSARLFREFLDYTSPGDEVLLTPGPAVQWPAWLEHRLNANELTVRDSPTVSRPGRRAEERPVPRQRAPRKGPEPSRMPSAVLSTLSKLEAIEFGKQGVLTRAGVARLLEFLAGLVSGDVVEIHHLPRNAAAVEAARRIKKIVSSASVTVLVPPASALLYPTAACLSKHCLVPGEHGFRFFPSYYRHLRNTLRRVPTFEFDDRQIPQLTTRESGETVLDNLVNTPVQALAGIGTNPLLYPRCPAPSVGAIAHQLKSVLLERGYDLRDIGQFMLRLVRYMSTGSKRRALEMDRISWWQYLRGYDPVTGIYRFRYSDRFTRDLGESPRVLAAFDAEWGDAHTNGNTFVQLLLNQFHQTEDVDQVLNAPTSEAWFEHWEQYLRTRLDVRFVAASLVKLSEQQPAAGNSRAVTATLYSRATGEHVTLGQAGPIVDPDLFELNEALADSDRNYFVMAVDAKTAEARTADLPSDLRVGVAREIQGFERVVRGSPTGEEPPQLRPDEKYGHRPWDRFQTLTGIQFFFRNVTGVFDGHVYYMDAPWALSSINQQLFWRISLISRFAPYRGLLSADIGRFTDAWTIKDPKIIAENAWEQIRNALRDYWQSDRVDDRINLIKPTWFHIDSTVDLQQQKNNSPYLIPIVDDWQNRPCDVLFDPGEGLESPVPLPDDPDRLSWAPWGGYRVHWGEWLFAGTYMRHFTRMTTMEAANESGRHAVNAILDHLSQPQTMNLPADFAPRRRYSTAGNPLEPHTAYVPTPTGDYCHIWDMENYELADLVHLREIDDWLAEQGLPHACDLVGGEVIPSMVSYLPSASELGLPTAADIVRALSPPFHMPGFQSPFGPSGLSSPFGLSALQSLFGGASFPWQGIWPWPK